VDWSHWTACLLLAEEGGENAPAEPSHLWLQILPFVVIGFLFYLLLIRPQRQEQTRRQTMLSAVKKNDRVITAGGIYGLVTNVRPERDEVTIQVDESTNTRIRVTLSSIARIQGAESSDESSSKQKS
jgi:preprotein translocase subunit YajC